MAYDGVYWLTQETVTEPCSGTPMTTVYNYDDANNRLSKVVTGGSEAGAWSYTSNALNQLTAFTRQSGATGPVAVSYTYDANGNRETRVAQASSLPPETTTYAWDNENRLIEVDKAGRCIGMSTTTAPGASAGRNRQRAGSVWRSMWRMRPRRRWNKCVARIYAAGWAECSTRCGRRARRGLLLFFTHFPVTGLKAWSDSTPTPPQTRTDPRKPLAPK